jgi:hypothetical protein
MKANLLFTLVLTAAIFTACQTGKTVAAATISREEILAFLKQYDDAWNSKNIARVDSLFGTSYTYFTSTGKVNKRAESLAMLAADYYRLLNANRSEVEVFLDGNTAVVSSRWKGHGTWKGSSFTDDQRCGLIIQKQNGQLKLLSEHCVQIAKDTL